MDVKFKCRNCQLRFSQPLFQGDQSFYDNWGLMVWSCPHCKNPYMDCENLHDCLEALKDAPPSSTHIDPIKRT